MRPSFSSLYRQSWIGSHAMLAALFVAMLAAELFVFRFLDTTESRMTDMFMRRHASAFVADPAIVVIDIDDASLSAMQDLAGLWSWPRDIHADLLDALAPFKPRCVVFDITFSERDLKRPKSDARLSDAIRSMPNVYLSAVHLAPSRDQSGTPVDTLSTAFGITGTRQNNTTPAIQLPHAIAPAAWKLGLTNSLEDADGVLRRYPLQSNLGGWILPSLPARVVADSGASLPRAEAFLMRWPNLDAGHRRYSYGELFRLLTEKRPTLTPAELHTLDSLFRDKIIVIGMSATGAFDHHLTPMGAGYTGVDILALAIDNLKNNQHVAVLSRTWSFGFGSILIAGLAIAFARRVNPLTIGALLGAMSLVALAAADYAIVHNTMMPVVTSLVFGWAWFLLAAVAGYLRERRLREQAVALFARFLNPDVVRQIVDQGETVESLSGRTRDITVLFSDIRGFTTLSETRPPHEVVALLNRYFERQVEVVFNHGGTLDKFIGDCIMAFWGAPLDDPHHAQHAVAAAMEMQATLLEFKKELVAEGSNVSDFDVGIGIHTGTAVVGFIGARRKIEYTAIGDTVNLASRVEGLTKGVARILVTQETMLACRSVTELDFEECGAFAVKGRAADVTLYQPIRTPS